MDNPVYNVPSICGAGRYVDQYRYSCGCNIHILFDCPWIKIVGPSMIAPIFPKTYIRRIKITPATFQIDMNYYTSSKNCIMCSVMSNVTTYTVETSAGQRRVSLCPDCKTQSGITDILYVFRHDDVFPDPNSRERDNIVWRITQNELVWPLILNVNPGADIEVSVLKRPVLLDRDYLCHDDLLYEVADFPTSRLIGQPAYAYRFTKAIYDGSRYVIGFLTDGRSLTADYVEMTDDTDEYE